MQHVTVSFFYFRLNDRNSAADGFNQQPVDSGGSWACVLNLESETRRACFKVGRSHFRGSLKCLVNKRSFQSFLACLYRVMIQQSSFPLNSLVLQRFRKLSHALYVSNETNRFLASKFQHVRVTYFKHDENLFLHSNYSVCFRPLYILGYSVGCAMSTRPDPHESRARRSKPSYNKSAIGLIDPHRQTPTTPEIFTGS